MKVFFEENEENIHYIFFIVFSLYMGIKKIKTMWVFFKGFFLSMPYTEIVLFVANLLNKKNLL